MKRSTIVVSVLIGLTLAIGVAWAKMSKYSNYTYGSYTLTTSATTDLSVRTDTIWLNRSATPVEGGNNQVLNLRQFSGFRTRITVGPMLAADTAATILKHNAGVVDTILFVVKKKLGNIVSLIDSTAATVVRLRTASKTQTISFLIGSGATDTLCADEIFGVLRVADSTSDTAGIRITYPVSVETHFKE